MSYSLDSQQTASLLNPPVQVIYQRPAPTAIRPIPSQSGYQHNPANVFQGCPPTTPSGNLAGYTTSAVLPYNTLRFLQPGQGQCS